MTAKRKIAHRKLSILHLAERLNNVREACRLMGYGRQPVLRDQASFSAPRLRGTEGPGRP